MIRPLNYSDAALGIVGACALVLSVALVLEHGFYMEPCALCLTQRLFFMLAGLAALASLTSSRQGPLWPVLTGAALSAGAYFALRQLYLYTLPADQIPACSAPINRLIEFAPISEVLRAMTVGTGSCAEASFPFLGFQLPGIVIPLSALITFAVLLLLCWWQWQDRAR